MQNNYIFFFTKYTFLLEKQVISICLTTVAANHADVASRRWIQTWQQVPDNCSLLSVAFKEHLSGAHAAEQRLMQYSCLTCEFTKGVKGL